ncbi:hypothetical protein NMG60_11031739 [Bertholletia excelsa]
MEDQTAINPCWTNPELDSIRSRIKELRDAHRSSDDAPELSPSDSEQLLKDCARQLESTVNEVLSQFSDVGSLTIADLDAYSARLKEELNNVEDENAKISSEIGDLMRTYKEDSSRLEIELEGLDSSLDYIASKMLGFSHQIENKKMILKSLQGLDCVLKRFEAIDKIEDTLTGLQVIEYEGNCIRLLLKTFVPDSLLSQHMIEDVAEPLQHELKIEVAEGKLEIKSVEISPNDVYIDEVIDTAKSDGQFFNMSIMKLRSSLEWFVRRVQDRIVLCRLRQLLVKFANKSRQDTYYVLHIYLTIAQYSASALDLATTSCSYFSRISNCLQLKHSILN